MNFNSDHSISILQRTPSTISTLCLHLPNLWLHTNEGVDSWSTFDIIGHLIHGEKTDWIPRAQMILNDSDAKKFHPFDRFAQFNNSKSKSIEQLLIEFQELRKKNIETMISWNLQPADYLRVGMHPEFGTVTLQELIATWTVHDLVHINQISRLLAGVYKEDIGPWKAYMNVLK